MTIRDTKILDEMWQSHIARAEKARDQRARQAELSGWIDGGNSTIADLTKQIEELAKKVSVWSDERDGVSLAAQAYEKQSADYADLVEEKRQGTDWEPPPAPAQPVNAGPIFDQVSAELPLPAEKRRDSDPMHNAGIWEAAECEGCGARILRNKLDSGPWGHPDNGSLRCYSEDEGSPVATPKAKPAEPAPEQTTSDAEAAPAREEATTDA